MDHQLVKTSKFLSLVLRHQPGKIGLTLDSQGWAAAGFMFFRSANSVWLTDHMPSEYLEVTLPTQIAN